MALYEYDHAKRGTASDYLETIMEKINNIALVLDDEDGFAGRRFHGSNFLSLYFASLAGFVPAFSFKACVNSCRLVTIWGAFVRTVLASFSE